MRNDKENEDDGGSVIVNTSEDNNNNGKPESNEDANNKTNSAAKQKPEYSNVVGGLAVLLYGSVSLAQTMFNKTVLSVYDFDGGQTILLLQMLLTVTILTSCKVIGVLTFPDLNMKTAKKLLPLSMCFFVNVLLGLIGLDFLSVAIYSVLRRMVTLFILLLEQFVLHKYSPLSIWLSVAVMGLGAFVTGASDLKFNAIGYIVALASCLFQALYLILLKKFAKDIGPVEMLMYNCLESIPFVSIIIVYFKEYNYVMAHPAFSHPAFKAYFTLSIILGAALNFCIFFCTAVNSPLTTSVTGHAKNIFTTIIGTMIFKDLAVTFNTVLGLTLNASGGIWYSYLKMSSGGG